MSSIVHLVAAQKDTRPKPGFQRDELGQILSLYSLQVAKGEWRDYAIDLLENGAVFSIFRHSHERPLYTLSKALGHKKRYAEFFLHTGTREIAKSRELIDVLQALRTLVLAN